MKKLDRIGSNRKRMTTFRTPIRIVCYGDSITEAAANCEADRWTAILAGRLNAWKPGRFSVHNRGKGGDTTARALDNVRDLLLPLLPAVVLLEFGINDAYVLPWTRIHRQDVAGFKANLAELQRIVMASGGLPVFLTNHRSRCTHAQGNRRRFEVNYRDYNPAIRAVARRAKAPLIDLPVELNKREIPWKSLLGADGLHLSDAGNHSYAEAVFGALRDILEQQRLA